MTRYQKNKNRVREEAIEYQILSAETRMYWSEVADYAAHFEKLGRRYGLLKEFRENGII